MEEAKAANFFSDTLLAEKDVVVRDVSTTVKRTPVRIIHSRMCGIQCIRKENSLPSVIVGRIGDARIVVG